MEEFNKFEAQRNARLESTVQCIKNLRLARELGHSPELCLALFQLTEKIARMEWGPETIIDDFSDPDFFIVMNGTKEKRI